MTKWYECELQGNVLAKVKIGYKDNDNYDRETIVIFKGTLESQKYMDVENITWGVDRREWVYDENNTDINDVKPIDENEFSEVKCSGKTEENTKDNWVIKEVVEVFDFDLEEVE